MATIDVSIKDVSIKNGFDLDSSIGYRVELVERTLKRKLSQRFLENGIDITPNQWVILYRLYNQDGLSQAEISDNTFKDRANVTRIIDLLVRKGLVERLADATDRRVFRITLTGKGRKLMEKLPGIVSGHIEKATEGISVDALETTILVLDAILLNFE